MIPYQDGRTTLTYETNAISTVFGVTLDGHFVGTTTTDSAGLATVQVILERGDHEIVIEDDVTAHRIRDFVSVCDDANFYLGAAESLELNDDEIAAIENGRAIGTADSQYLDDVHGAYLGFSNGGALSLEAYRAFLVALTGARRQWSATKRGVSDALQGLTSSRPFWVPKAWLPVWRLSDGLIANGSFRKHTLTSTAIVNLPAVAGGVPTGSVSGVDLATLNAVPRQWIHAAYGDTTLAFPGPIGTMPTAGRAERVTVTFSGTWNRGSVTVTGYDADNILQSEVFATGTSITRAGVIYFREVTGIVHSAAGSAGTATVGLRDRRFVTIVGFDSNTTIDTHGLLYNSSTSTLSWDYALALTPVTRDITLPSDLAPLIADGSYVPNLGLKLSLPGAPQSSYLVGANAEPFDFTQAYVLQFAADGLPMVNVSLSALTTAADVVDAINDALTASTVYDSTDTDYELFALTSSSTYVQLRDPSTPISYGSASTIALYPSAYCKPNVGDAAKVLFGVPREANFLSADYNAGDTTFTVTSSASLPAVFTARVGRGQRTSDTNKSVTIASSAATSLVTCTNAKFTPADVGGYLLLANMSGANNNGLHYIESVIRGTNQATITNAVAPVAFTAQTDASSDWKIFSMGEEVSVTANNTGTGVLTLAAAIADVTTDTTKFLSGAFVEIAADMPMMVRGIDDVGGAEVYVDPTFAPASTTNDTVTVVGSSLADDWARINAPSLGRAYPGLFAPYRLILTTTAGGDPTIETRLIERATEYAGWRIRVDAYVQNHGTASRNFRINYALDGDAASPTWVTGSNTSVAVTPFVGLVGDDVAPGPLVPTRVRQEFEVTSAATQVRIRLVYDSSSVGEDCTIHAVFAYALTTPASTVDTDSGDVSPEGVWLGNSTIIRNERRDNLRELLYAWCQDDLDDATNNQQWMRTQLGISERDATTNRLLAPSDSSTLGSSSGALGSAGAASRGTVAGLIDKIASVSAFVERTSRPTTAIAGCYNTTEWGSATLVNMTLDTETPSRLSRAVPSRVSDVTSALSFTGTGPYVANLSITSDHDGPFNEAPSTSDLLYSSDRFEATAPQSNTGVTLISDNVAWTWSAANQISVAGGEYDSTRVYFLRYVAPISAQTGDVDLGASFSSYVWLFDAPVWIREENVRHTLAETERVLTFDANLNAPILPLASLAQNDVANAVLSKDDGVHGRISLPRTVWRFTDDATLRITDGTAFDPDSIYTLSYTSAHVQAEPTATVTYEARSATTQPGLAAATWAAIEPEDALDLVRNASTGVGVRRWWQFRATLTDVLYTGDVVIWGLGAKGILTRGTTPDAPGIVIDNA